MNSALIGTWDLESGVNINDYLKQLGIAAIYRLKHYLICKYIKFILKVWL